MSNPHSPLRLNVGFIVHATIGFTRDFPFEIPSIQFPQELNLNNLTGTARITRTPQGLLVQVRMHALMPTECVRCLDAFALPLEVDFTELYAFTSRTVTESGLILPEDGYIDLEPLVREYMLLEIPIRPLCKPDCKGLCPTCGGNLNQTICDHTADSVDPRLAILKSLLEKR